MDPLDTKKLYSISHDLKSLNEVLSLLNTSCHVTLSGYQITDTLIEPELGLLEVIRTNHVRRRAAPILARLIEMGVTVDVDFDYVVYLPKEEEDADDL